MITRTLITTLAVIMALAVVMTPIAHAIMWIGPGGHVGSPTPPSRHGGAPINTPQVTSIGYGGGSGSGVSTFSPPQGNTGSGYGRFPHAVPMMRTPPPTNGLSDGSVGNGAIAQGNPGSGQGSVTVIDTNNNGQLTVTKVNENGNGYTVTTTTYNGNGQPVSQTTLSVGKGQTVTSTNTTTIQTITKTYTQYIYDTYEVDHYIYNYMYPIIQWVFTLVNIGQYQQPGYHSVGSEKLFLPGSGSGNGIFVPVFAQEAVYTYNIAPSTKPQITGWYTGKTSQSSSGPFLVSQSSTPPQLSSIQDAVNTIQQQASYTVPNITKITTYWNYITQPSPSPTPNPIPPPNNTSPQPPVLPESWITFQKAGPGGVGGNYIVKYGPGGLAPVLVTYNSTVAQQWGSAFQSLGNAISNTLDAIGSALTNVVTAPISILTGFANAIDNAISNGLRAVNLP